MSIVHGFIATLFEKSQVLNDLNTKYLKELEMGDLPVTEKVNLFYRNTEYHEHILKVISDIVKELDKTSILLSPVHKQLLDNFNTLDTFMQGKTYKVIEALKDTQFIPKKLSICPKCGAKLSSDIRVAECRKVPLRIGDKTLGYTYHCFGTGLKKGRVKSDELE